MAITLISSPTSPLESYTPTVYSVSSDNYLCKKMRGAFALVSGETITLQVQPSLSGSVTFDFDIQEFYRDNLSYDIQDPATATSQIAANNSYVEFNAVVFTELLDSNGQLVAGDQLTDGTNKYVLNAARQVYNPSGLVGYRINTSLSNSAKFLTNIPRTIDISSSESFTLSYWNESATINNVRVVWRDINNNSLGTDDVTITGAVGRFDLPIGLANLATAGITPPTGAAAYEVRLGILSGTFTSYTETVRFRITNDCYTQPARIHFLNRWGGFDSYTFRDGKRLVNTSSSVYEKPLLNGFTAKDRGRQSQYRDVTPSLQLTSDILPNSTALWLEELIGSPVAYIEESGQLIPVTINDGQFTTSDRISLKQLKLSVTYSNNIRNQRL